MPPKSAHRALLQQCRLPLLRQSRVQSPILITCLLIADWITRLAFFVSHPGCFHLKWNLVHPISQLDRREMRCLYRPPKWFELKRSSRALRHPFVTQVPIFALFLQPFILIFDI